MRRFNGQSTTRMFNRLDAGKLRDLLFAKAREMKPSDVYRATQNRESRRTFARAMRRHGRGFTTPRSGGRAHTRGSGRS